MTISQQFKNLSKALFYIATAATFALHPMASSACESEYGCDDQGAPILANLQSGTNTLKGSVTGSNELYNTVGVRTDTTDITKIGVDASSANKNLLVGGDTTSAAKAISGPSISQSGDSTAYNGGNKTTSGATGGSNTTTTTLAPTTTVTPTTTSGSTSGGGNVSYNVDAEKAISLRFGFGTPQPAQLPSTGTLAGTRCYRIDTETGVATPLFTTPGTTHVKPDQECIDADNATSIKITQTRAGGHIGATIVAKPNTSCNQEMAVLATVMGSTKAEMQTLLAQCIREHTGRTVTFDETRHVTRKPPKKDRVVKKGPDCKTELKAVREEVKQLKAQLPAATAK